MKLIIDIPEEMYDWIKTGFPDEEDGEHAIDTIRNGTVLGECKAEDCISREDAKALFKDDVAAINELNNLPSVYPKSDKPQFYPPCEDCNSKMDEIRNAYDNMTTKALERKPILDKSCRNCKWNKTNKCQPSTCAMTGCDGHGLWKKIESEVGE